MNRSKTPIAPISMRLSARRLLPSMILNLDDAVSSASHCGFLSRIARQAVIARSVLDDIRAGAAKDLIGARTAMDSVKARLAIHRVVAIAAVGDVVFLARVNGVVATQGLEHIGAKRAGEDVAVFIALDERPRDGVGVLLPRFAQVDAEVTVREVFAEIDGGNIGKDYRPGGNRFQ